MLTGGVIISSTRGTVATAGHHRRAALHGVVGFMLDRVVAFVGCIATRRRRRLRMADVHLQVDRVGVSFSAATRPRKLRDVNPKIAKGE
jgi:hypothetical protein